MSRGAPLTVLEDSTPLNAAEVDVARRVGWTVRMVRLNSPVDGRVLTLEDLAGRAGVSTTRLHRLETGVLRDGALIDTYESLLERPVGSLRAPVDIVCRTFPGVSPPDRDPASRLCTVAAVSAATERVTAPHPSPGQWLSWARAMAAPGNVGMPESTMLDLVARLASELARSVGHGYAIRYEALAILRCSGYGHLVLQAARSMLADRHVQVVNDLTSAVGEQASPEALAWSLELLDDSRPLVRIGGSIALEAMAAVARDPDFWRPLVPGLIDRLEHSEPGSTTWEWISHLVRLVPPQLLRDLGTRPRRALAPTPDAAAPPTSWAERAWRDSHRGALRVAESLDLPEQPVLTRLVFDMVFGPFETHGVTSFFLLGAVPGLAEPLAQELGRLAQAQTDPVIAARALRRVAAAQAGTSPPGLGAWLEDEADEVRVSALRLAAQAGTELGTTVLERAVRGAPRVRQAGLYAAGMLAHPVLSRWADERDEELAGAARWWLEQGGRCLS